MKENTRSNLQLLWQQAFHDHQAGHWIAAIAKYEAALALEPTHAEISRLYGTLLLQMDRVEEAVEWLKNAASHHKNHPGLLTALAHALFSARDYSSAEKNFRRASLLSPQDNTIKLGLASSLAAQGKLEDAERQLRQLLSKMPNDALLWFNLGNIHRDRHSYLEAEKCYRQTLVLSPNLAEARNNLGAVLHAQERFQEAEAEFRHCIVQNPDFLLPCCNLASVLIDIGRFSEAEEICRNLLTKENNVTAHTYLGAALGHQGRLAEAAHQWKQALLLNPQDPKLRVVYACALIDLGLLLKGMRELGPALKLNALESPENSQMLAVALLAQGCFSEGWVLHKDRPAARHFNHKYPQINTNTCLPEKIVGKKIMILREQGLGDELFFLRFVPEILRRNAMVCYLADSRLKELLQESAQNSLAGINLISDLEAASTADTDSCILVGDLPLAFCTDLGTTLHEAIPFQFDPLPGWWWGTSIRCFAPEPPPPLPLQPCESRITRINSTLEKIGPAPYLALTWRAGTPEYEQRGTQWQLKKQAPLHQLADALRGFKGTVISIQRNPLKEELDYLAAALESPFADFANLNSDLREITALLYLIDEYVGVSNTNMHLRAGLGKGAKVLVPSPYDWRWMNHGAVSPWFPDFKVYRQTHRGEWGQALSQLAKDITLDA